MNYSIILIRGVCYSIAIMIINYSNKNPPVACWPSQMRTLEKRRRSIGIDVPASRA